MASGITASLMEPKEKYEPNKNMTTTRLHVIPVGDEQHGKLKLHVAAQDCWCHPTEKDDVVTHNAFDCREKLERQEVQTGKIWTHVLENKQVCSESLPGSMMLERIREGARVAQEHAGRHIGDYGAKGSSMNEAHWMGFRGGVAAMETIVETVFFSAEQITPSTPSFAMTIIPPPPQYKSPTLNQLMKMVTPKNIDGVIAEIERMKESQPMVTHATEHGNQPRGTIRPPTAICGLRDSAERQEHAPLSAGAEVECRTGDETTGQHENRTADRGCVSRLVRFFDSLGRQYVWEWGVRPITMTCGHVAILLSVSKIIHSIVL